MKPKYLDSIGLSRALSKSGMTKECLAPLGPHLQTLSRLIQEWAVITASVDGIESLPKKVGGIKGIGNRVVRKIQDPNSVVDWSKAISAAFVRCFSLRPMKGRLTRAVSILELVFTLPKSLGVYAEQFDDDEIPYPFIEVNSDAKNSDKGIEFLGQLCGDPDDPSKTLGLLEDLMPWLFEFLHAIEGAAQGPNHEAVAKDLTLLWAIPSGDGVYRLALRESDGERQRITYGATSLYNN